MTDDTGDLVEVHAMAFPVSVHQRATEHQQELQREFQLILIDAAEHEVDVPKRLFELVEAVGARFEGIGDEQTEQIDKAFAGGTEMIDDLVYRVPRAVSGACVALSRMLDECDEYCRRGEALLTLATPDEAIAYRRWLLGEFVAQISGLQPTPWTDVDRRALVGSPLLRGEA